MDSKFKCDCCGVCCKMAYKVPELKDYIGSDGKACKYLTKDNKCSIYNNRPSICNVHEQWKLHYQRMPWEEFKALNEDQCIRLKAIYKEL